MKGEDIRGLCFRSPGVQSVGLIVSEFSGIRVKIKVLG